KDLVLKDVMDDLSDQLNKKVTFIADGKAGVNSNAKITLNKKDATLEEVLTAICTQRGDWGWYVKSKEKHAYNGSIIFTVGKQRGYENIQGPAPSKDGDEPKDKPDKDKAKDKDKDKDKTKTKDKAKDKDKAEPKDKGAAKDKSEPKDKAESEEDKAERSAAL